MESVAVVRLAERQGPEDGVSHIGGAWQPGPEPGGAFAKEFEVEVDKKCKDASRLTFVSTYEDILLVNPQIITYENQSFVDKWNGRYCDGSADLDLFADGAAGSGADHQGKPVDEESLSMTT